MARESIWGSNAAPPVVWIIAISFIVFELLFALGDAGVFPGQDFRWEIYKLLAFFDVYFDAMLEGVTVPWWFWTSFLSHAFLHGGLLHLFMNTAIFVALGSILARTLGAARFVILFVVCAIGGGLVFGIIAEAQGPLVGASGAIFGFFGALKRWEWRWIRATGAPSNRFWGTILGLTAINVALALVIRDASIAWEAHLGGFVTGWLIAPALAPGKAGPSPF